MNVSPEIELQSAKLTGYRDAPSLNRHPMTKPESAGLRGFGNAMADDGNIVAGCRALAALAAQFQARRDPGGV
jgi:hypothetical protein